MYKCTRQTYILCWRMWSSCSTTRSALPKTLPLRFCANILLPGLLNTDEIRVAVCKERNNRHQIFESPSAVAAERRTTAESMLPTRSSGYTVLSPQKSLRPARGAAPRSERDAHRAAPEQRSGEPLSDSIGVACNRLLILTRPAALCVFLSTWQWGQITGTPQATGSLSSSYQTPTS